MEVSRGRFAATELAGALCGRGGLFRLHSREYTRWLIAARSEDGFADAGRELDWGWLDKDALDCIRCLIEEEEELSDSLRSCSAFAMACCRSSSRVWA